MVAVLFLAKILNMENREFIVDEDIIASSGYRFCNFLIDLIVRYIILFFTGILLAIVALLTDNPSLRNLSFWEESLLGIVLMIIYYAIFEGLFSRSIGKYITQTIVVNEDGSKPSFKRIMKRTFCRLIPFNHFTFIGYDARGWHDSLSDTYVVKKRAFDREMRLFKLSIETERKNNIF